jgi:hypothetical protein
LTLEELSLIQKDLAELQPLDAAALKIMLEKELLVYNIMLMRFSQRKADRLAMAPKETAALVKSISGATGKISAASIPVITPDGRMIDVAPNQVVDDIDAFFRKEGAAAIGRFQTGPECRRRGQKLMALSGAIGSSPDFTIALLDRLRADGIDPANKGPQKNPA